MSKLPEYFNKFVQYSLKVILCKIYFKSYKKIYVNYEIFVSKLCEYRGKNYNKIQSSYIANSQSRLSFILDRYKKTVLEEYLNHRFNYLGSGWVNYSKKNVNRTLVNLDINSINVDFSKTILHKITPTYELLNWQLDVISKFEWSTRNHWTKSLKIIGLSNGVDIKTPWEFGRLYHLPQLALMAENDSEYHKTSIIEFKNVVLDFYANNPLYYGVQWACAMDVSIRAVNLILSYQLFKKNDKNGFLNKEFDSYFSDLIFIHGKYIFNHLEKEPGFSNNHYFSNICGLLFISSFIKTDKTNKWMIYSINEFCLEFDKQFNSDGSNFEASTAYHFLVSEMVLYSTALLLGLKSNIIDQINSHKFIKVNNNQIEFSEIFENKLSNVFNFCRTVIDPNDNIIQIGDNDSGRFLNFTPDWKYNTSTSELDENCLNKNSILAGFYSLFNESNSDYNNFPEFDIVRLLSNGRSIRFNASECAVKHDIVNNFNIPNLIFSKNTIFDIDNSVNLTKEIKTFYFKDFGLIIWKNHDLWMSLYFGNVGQCGNGGHSHNDKLSINLFIKKYPVAIDPGTFNYTSFPKERNKFRSYMSHPEAVNISSYSPEFSRYHLFSFPEKFDSHILYLSNKKVKVLIKKDEKIFLREVRIDKKNVYSKTKSNFDFKIGKGSKEYSSGYGKKK